MAIADVQKFVRRTGRAELDEHAEGVNMSEYLLELDPPLAPLSRTAARRDPQRDAADTGHCHRSRTTDCSLDLHMLSGVKAQVGIKIYGTTSICSVKRLKRSNLACKQCPGPRTW